MAKLKRPTVRIHDLESNEIIDREMNDTEFQAWQTDQVSQAARQVEAEARQTQRQAILDRLGLTADEAKLILG